MAAVYLLVRIEGPRRETRQLDALADRKRRVHLIGYKEPEKVPLTQRERFLMLFGRDGDALQPEELGQILDHIGAGHAMLFRVDDCSDPANALLLWLRKVQREVLSTKCFVHHVVQAFRCIVSGIPCYELVVRSE